MGTGHPITGAAQAARVVLYLAALILVACAIGAVCCGCPSPRLPAVEGCTPRASMCRNDSPHVCSSSGRWHAVGDLTCGGVGAVCVEGADGGVAHCAAVTDGGAHE